MKMVELGDICEFKYGKSLPEKKRKEGSYNVYGSNGAVGSHEAAITKGPTLIVGRKGSIGEVVFSDKECWPIDTTYFVDQTCTKQNLRWMFYALKHLRLQELNRATGVPGLNRNDAYEKKLVIPSPEEQKRVAAILDQADSLRRARRQSIEKLNSLSQSLFHAEIGNPVTNDKGWPTHKIDDLCKLVRGSSPRPKGDPRYYGGNVPRLMIADITRDGWLVTPRIDSLTEDGAKKSRPAPKGTIVMAVSGNIGLVSQLAVDACVHDGFVAFLDLDIKKIMPLYFMHLMHNLKKTHDNWKAGAIFKNITTTDIKQMNIPVPPKDIQQKFIKGLEGYDALLSIQKKSLEELDNLFLSLQQRAFRGEL